MSKYKSMCSDNIVPSTLLVIVYYLLIAASSIGARQIPDHKCSHSPPKPNEINDIWTFDPVQIDEVKQLDLLTDYYPYEIVNNFQNLEEKTEKKANNLLTKRHVGKQHQELTFQHERSDVEPDPNFLIGNRKDIINYKFYPFSHIKKDLIPMKISVYYDESVYQLEESKSILIREHIIPTVIEFFESALSIRREFAIDTFRITRKCANITYAKDNNNIARPFCLNKCDDHSICGEMIVPQSHLAGCSYCNTTTKKCYMNHSMEGKGVTDTQLLLYVSARKTSRCGREQTVAYAAHCAQDSKTDRPVAGHANLCPNSISDDLKEVNSLIATVKHELTHVLGFSVSLFAFYRDQEGKPLTDRKKWAQTNIGPNNLPKDPKTGYPIWSDKIIRKVIRRGWVSGQGIIDKEVFLLVTPTVVREVRAHFNCSTLEGAELEDQGHDGTSMTHWEKRLFENEAMTGTHTHRSVYSRLTLAALQDTGWYVANFSVAERLYWGKNLGCDFATQSCKFWIDKQRSSNSTIAPFCDKIKSDQLQITCTSDHSAKAVCNMRKYKQPLADFYKNFHELDGVHPSELAFYGGTVDLADYCPYVQEYTLQQHPVLTQGSRCFHVENNLDPDKNVALEYFGPSSRCFVHGRAWTNRTCAFKRRFWPHLGAGCYKTFCSQGFFSIIVNNMTYSCYYKGQELEIVQGAHNTLYNGSIICPACDMMCPSKSCAVYNKVIIDDMIDLSRVKAKMMTSISNFEDDFHKQAKIAINQIVKNNHLILASASKRLSKLADIQVTISSNDNMVQYNDEQSDHKTVNHKFSKDAQLIQKWLEVLNRSSQSDLETDIFSDLDEHLKLFKIMIQSNHQNEIIIQRSADRYAQSGPSICSTSLATYHQTPGSLVLLIAATYLNLIMMKCYLSINKS